MLTAPPKPLLRIPKIICPACEREFHGLSPRGICWSCAEKAIIAEGIKAAADKLLANMPEEIRARLAAMGMGAREIAAIREGICKPIQQAFRGPLRRSVEELGDGRIPSSGFGLTGPTGMGKSCALAVLVRAYTEQVFRRRAPLEGQVPMDVSVLWCSWPAEAEWMRNNGTDSRATARRLEALSCAPLLVLDDLGAEGRKGDYLEDYATKKLDLVIDARSREMLPTIWTSNMDELWIGKTYGGRISSRLLGENQPIAVTGPDLRLA